MAQPAHMVVGLGNPGADYHLSRHNIGFMALDVVAEMSRAGAWQKKFKSLLSFARIGEAETLLLKPQTYMNLSGEAAGEALRYYKLAPENVFVIHDDIDLPPGAVRVKRGGGHGGHNGLRSLDAHIGKDYWRVRLGVGRPAHKSEVTDFVLGHFAKADKAWVDPLLSRLGSALPLLLAGEAAGFSQAVGGSERSDL